MDPIIGTAENSNSNADLIAIVCCLCEEQFFISGSSSSDLNDKFKVRDILYAFISEKDHLEIPTDDGICSLRLCRSCKSLCKSLNHTIQTLSTLVDNISHLLVRRRKVSHVLPKSHIAQKLLQLDNSFNSTTTTDIVISQDSSSDSYHQQQMPELTLSTEQNHRGDVIVSINSSDITLILGQAQSVKSETGSILTTVDKHHPIIVSTDSSWRSTASCSTVVSTINTKTLQLQQQQQQSSSFGESISESTKIPKLEIVSINDGGSATSKKKHQCNVCLRVCRTSRDLQLHLGSHTQEKKFTCEVCGLSYRHKKALEVHIGMHRGESKFSCQHCHKCFTQKAALQRHIPIHTGERVFQCDQCGKSFLYHTSFNVHKLTHSGQKQFSCTQQHCGQKFFSKSHLRRHLKTHTGIKPHACNICSKSFSERYNLVAHMRIHKGTKAHNCPICGTGYNRKHKLQEHINSVHTIVSSST